MGKDAGEFSAHRDSRVAGTHVTVCLSPMELNATNFLIELTQIIFVLFKAKRSMINWPKS